MGERILSWTVAVVGGIAAVTLLLFHYKQHDSYYCQVCWSKKDVVQWWVGSWMGATVPLTPKCERVAETRFLQDFFPTNHVHQWMFAQGSPYYFFGATSGGCAVGGGRHVSEVCQIYESSTDFRAFIKRKLHDGSLTRSNLIALVSRPVDAEASQDEAQALLSSFLGP
jgi:hypothetical protein